MPNLVCSVVAPLAGLQLTRIRHPLTSPVWQAYMGHRPVGTRARHGPTLTHAYTRRRGARIKGELIWVLQRLATAAGGGSRPSFVRTANLVAELIARLLPGQG